MLTRLYVLGWLNWRRVPTTGYEIQQYLQLNQTEHWAGILPGSIYHALKKLAAEGFVALQQTEQSGNRNKALYTITPAGKEELQRLLLEAWSVPMLHYPSNIYIALTFLDALPREVIVKAIEEQIARLEKEIEFWKHGKNIKVEYSPAPIRTYLGLMFDNGREHMEIDLAFLRLLQEMIPLIGPLPSFSDFPPLNENMVFPHIPPQEDKS